MPGRLIRPSGKEKWIIPGWHLGVGPFDKCFCMCTHVGYMMGAVFFVVEKTNRLASETRTKLD